MPVFKYYVITSPTVVQTKIFFCDTPFCQYLFSCRPLYQPPYKNITRSISRIGVNLLSTWDLHPATSWTENSRRMDILTNDTVSWEVWPLQRIKCLVKSNPCYVMISTCVAHVASASCTRTKLYLASLQQESPQTHHTIPQDVMLMNQFSYFLLPKDDYCNKCSDE